METGDQDGGAGGARLELGRLDALLGFHLRMATAALYREFAQAMEGTALTQKLFAVLELIDANPEVSQVDISATLDTDRATIMALVDRLEARGLVERQKSERQRLGKHLIVLLLFLDQLSKACTLSHGLKTAEFPSLRHLHGDTCCPQDRTRGRLRSKIRRPDITFGRHRRCTIGSIGRILCVASSLSQPSPS